MTLKTFLLPTFLALFPFLSFSQNGLDLSYSVELGKRKNVIWDREIKEANIGDKWYTSYYPLYFKVGDEGKWDRVGPRGKNVRPYVPDTEFSTQHFRSFQKKKRRSYWALAGAGISLMGCSYSSLSYGIQNRDISHRMFLNPQSLAFLSGYIGGYLLGTHWNTQADLDLFMALHGSPIDWKHSRKVSWQVGSSTLFPNALALQMQF